MPKKRKADGNVVPIGDDGGKTGRSFVGYQELGPDLVCSRGECVGAVVEHLASEWLDVGSSSDVGMYCNKRRQANYLDN